jgi:hypothetical protein
MLSGRRVSAFALATATLYLLWVTTDVAPQKISLPRWRSDQHAALPCQSLPGINDTLIIFCTGSNELDDRFAIHLSTTLRCFPNHLIFSDHEEIYHGEHIMDALADVDPFIQANNPDFELYRRLRQGGRVSLDRSELAGPPDTFASMSGKTENPSWKLDKWKFLPMINRTLRERPEMKWYVFVEADTFILVSMLRQYLAMQDPAQLFYAGSQTFVAGDEFAHGGSGFVVSQPAMRKVVNHYLAQKSDIERFTNRHWCGDCVLGKVFTDSGVPLINTRPAFQGDDPGLLPYPQADAHPVPDESVRMLCHPAISYHHMSPAMIDGLWHFEQSWMAEHNTVSGQLCMVEAFVLTENFRPPRLYDTGTYLPTMSYLR